VTDLIATFPRLANEGYRITSPETDAYNCIAWAARRTDRWWWPDPDAYWPPGATQATTLAAFEEAYATLGYARCASGRFELRYEKVAIFADGTGKPTHAARQLESGRWTSKLGRAVDIEHATPDALAGRYYGAVALFMCRPRPWWRRPVAALRRVCAVLHVAYRRAGRARS
jgi:hypothetical protein